MNTNTHKVLVFILTLSLLKTYFHISEVNEEEVFLNTFKDYTNYEIKELLEINIT